MKTSNKNIILTPVVILDASQNARLIFLLTYRFRFLIKSSKTVDAYNELYALVNNSNLAIFIVGFPLLKIKIFKLKTSSMVCSI